MPHAGEAHHLIGVRPVAVHHVTIGNDPRVRQPRPDGVGLNEAQEFLPVGLGDILIGVGRHRCQIGEAVPHLEARRQVAVGLIAHALVAIQLQIIYAPVVRRQRADQLVLLRLFPLLIQQLFLQGQSLLQRLALHPVFRVRRFLFQGQAGRFAGLGNDEGKHPQQHQHRQYGLQHAAPDDAVGDGADLLGDHAFLDQIGQKPAGVFPHRHIGQCLPHAVIGEGDHAPVPLAEVPHHRIVIIALIKVGAGHGLQQIVLHRQAAQHRVAQGHARIGINVAEGGAVRLRLHGDARQHLLHIDLHEADHQLLPFQGQMVHRHGDDHLFLLAVQVQDGYLRPRDRAVIKGIFVNIRQRALGGIDQAIGIHKGQLVQMIDLLHLGLEGLQMGNVAQILRLHQGDGHVDVCDLGLQVAFHHLLPPPGQFIQVQQADGSHGSLRIPAPALAHPDRAQHQDQHHDHAAKHRNGDGFFAFPIHGAHSPGFFRLYGSFRPVSNAYLRIFIIPGKPMRINPKRRGNCADRVILPAGPLPLPPPGSAPPRRARRPWSQEYPAARCICARRAGKCNGCGS